MAESESARLSTSASLLQRLREPQPAGAWEKFVQLYTPLLLFWAGKAGLPPQDRLDLVQQVFVTLIQKMNTFEYDPNKRFRAWLYTVCQSKLVDWRRRNRHQIKNLQEADLSDLETDDELRQLWEKEHNDRLIERALELARRDFEPNTYQAFWATTREGKSAKEAARELGMTENAVFIAKCRVVRRLREELQDLLD